MKFKVNLSEGRPLYRQIIDQVHQRVARGELVAGDGLPSVRQLAEELVINHNTVAKAFSELVRDGTLTSQHGRGVFIAERRTVYSAAERKRRLNAAMDAFLADIATLDFPAEHVLSELAKRLEPIKLPE
jgi:GntR family transcriptional regulator